MILPDVLIGFRPRSWRDDEKDFDAICRNFRNEMQWFFTNLCVDFSFI